MKVTKGFPSPNFTQTPNDFFDFIPEMEESELKVTLVMIRQTFGFHRKGFKMSIGKLAKATGMSENSVKAGAKAAEDRGTFYRVNPDAITEAEWALVVDGSAVEGSTIDPLPGQPLTPNGSTIESQVGLKERKKRKKESVTLTEEDKAKAAAMVQAQLEAARKGASKYPNRDAIPEPYQQNSDAFVELTGLKPSKRDVNQWLAEFSDWQGEGVTPADIKEAVEYARSPRGFMVFSPASLTKTIKAIKAKRVVTPQAAPKIFRADPEAKPGEVPAHILEQREALRRRVQAGRNG